MPMSRATGPSRRRPTSPRWTPARLDAPPSGGTLAWSMTGTARRRTMKRAMIGVIGLVAACAVAAPAGGSTSERRVTLDSYCSPNGDYCQAVKAKGNKVKLQIASYSFSGEYKLCVKGPETKKCGVFELESTSGGIYADSVNWNGVFGYEGDGVYKVAWFLSGQKVGKTLGFQFG